MELIMTADMVVVMVVIIFMVMAVTMAVIILVVMTVTMVVIIFVAAVMLMAMPVNCPVSMIMPFILQNNIKSISIQPAFPGPAKMQMIAIHSQALQGLSECLPVRSQVQKSAYGHITADP